MHHLEESLLATLNDPLVEGQSEHSDDLERDQPEDKYPPVRDTHPVFTTAQ